MSDHHASKKSLSEVHQSVDVSSIKSPFKKFLAFAGPAYLISVGYMDPGNWATDITGGSKFGYSLLWILVVSNAIALLLQSFSARLGIVTGKDLAQASRDMYPPVINFCLYIFAEIAIAACDLAEVLGMAIGLELLFHFPLWLGISITIFDTFLLLFLLKIGIRKVEAFIIGLISVIAVSFLIELFFAKPNITEIAGGLIPSFKSNEAVYVALAILGATIMPHNLYLHSSLVQTRKFERTPIGIKKAIRFNIIDSAIALNLALFVNASILILSASAFFNNGLFGVTEIEDAYKFLQPLLGSSLAPILFAVALIASGQSSTITGTLAGQIIMEGHLQLRIQPWLRRLITRMLAIIPALLTVLLMGEAATGKLLVLSQFILSLQLPFAIIPLIYFAGSKKMMGDFAVTNLYRTLAWIATSLITGLNFYFVLIQTNEWVHDDSISFIAKFFLAMACVVVFGVLLFVIIYPILKKSKKQKSFTLHQQHKLHLKTVEAPKNIFISLDFSSADSKALNYALTLGGETADYKLLHIVETPGAIIYGAETEDFETRKDIEIIEKHVNQLIEQGIKVSYLIGYGNPKKAIPELVNEHKADMLVMGTHGHKGFKDLLLGTTVEDVRHNISVPLVLV
ncbi:MAG TPA: Nramp family divalent metal transporter [Bacteroidia bacterium]|nr:Nramp family divalent metal transporter [Bacteroidia bacterium]